MEFLREFASAVLYNRPFEWLQPARGRFGSWCVMRYSVPISRTKIELESRVVAEDFGSHEEALGVAQALAVRAALDLSDLPVFPCDEDALELARMAVRLDRVMVAGTSQLRHLCGVVDTFLSDPLDPDNGAQLRAAHRIEFPWQAEEVCDGVH